MGLASENTRFIDLKQPFAFFFYVYVNPYRNPYMNGFADLNGQQAGEVRFICFHVMRSSHDP